MNRFHWERRRPAGKIEDGAGFAGEDASAPRFTASIRAKILEACKTAS